MRKFITLPLAVLALAVAFQTYSFATTYYVATTGSDSANGTSLAAPFATIAHAIDVVNPGDTILVTGGTYTGGKVVTRNGSASAWITLQNYNGEKVVWNALSTDSEVMYFYGDGNFDPMYWIVNGLTMVGGDQYTLKIDVPYVNILNNDISGSYLDLIKMVQTSKNILISGNTIHNQTSTAGEAAIDAVGSVAITISHNWIHDSTSSAVIAKGNASNVIMEYNRVDNAGDRGFCLGQSTGIEFLYNGAYESYNGIIRDNILLNTAGPCLVASSSSNPEIYNNSCYLSGENYVGGIAVLNESESHQANTNVYIDNNILFSANNTGQPDVHVGPGAMTDNATLYLDSNVYWNASGPAATTFSWDDLNLYNVSLAAWQSPTGKDLNSIVANPQFSSYTTLNISGTSPAIQKAICDATHFCAQYDYLGTLRTSDGDTGPIDVGAYEYTGGTTGGVPPPVAQLPSTTTLTASPMASTLGTAVTFTAMVAPSSGTGTPTGTVQFLLNGSASGAPLSMTNGSASYTTASIPAGTQVATAVYGGDVNYYGSTSASVTLSVTGGSPDFSLTPAKSTLSIATGGTSSTDTLTIGAMNGFSGSVTFSCTAGLPAGGSCGFTPATVSTSGNTTLTITIPAAELRTGGAQAASHSRKLGWLGASGAAAMACMLLVGIPRRRRWSALLGILLLAAAAGGIGCGGGGTASRGGGNTTSSGTYTVTVTATSGTLTHTTAIAVAVQ
ncbi:MAG: Ig-like domain repeat protein [Acidobacteriaceae bacterium]